MNSSRIKKLIIILGLAVVWLANTGYLVSLLGSGVSWIRQGNGAGGGIAAAANERVQQALLCSLTVRAVPYEPSFENPFRQRSSKRVRGRSRGGRKDEYARRKLLLKGVLLKTNPLAILEDEEGRTRILGVGDTAYDQRVMRIDDDRVVLRDRQGTYDISVQE